MGREKARDLDTHQYCHTRLSNSLHHLWRTPRQPQKLGSGSALSVRVLYVIPVLVCVGEVLLPWLAYD